MSAGKSTWTILGLMVSATLFLAGCGGQPGQSEQSADSQPTGPQVAHDETVDTGDASTSTNGSGSKAEPTKDSAPNKSESKSSDKEADGPSADKTEPEGSEKDSSGQKNESPKKESQPKKKADSNNQADTPQKKAEKSAKKKGESAKAESGSDRVVSGDWPMWGGDINRNMVNSTTGVSIDFKPHKDPEKGKNILWTAQLGSQSYGNPVIADGKIYVGTNNGAQYRPQHEGDRGCLLCFDTETGDFLWQLTRKKLAAGRVNDWPEQGICSSPCVEGDRMWLVTNRCELMCVDTQGFYDGENDGPYKDEADDAKQDADIVWILDMINELGVFPHNLATSSPVVYGDLVYCLTSNGVDEAHKRVVSPRSPSFIAVNKKTGEVVWEDNTPFNNILHGQWSSPAIGIVDGQAQVYFPGGDGWLYALDAQTGEHIWKFDLNPKDSEWLLGGRGTRNAIISTPVFHKNSVILGVGQDPEHGEGVGHIYRIDATKTGDISPKIADGSGGWKKNPNSGQIWHFGGVDEDGSITGREGGLIFRRTMSTVAIKDGLVYAPDLSGFFHCLDFETGKQHWVYDTFAAVWGSPMVVDGKVFLGDEDGDLVILKAGKEKEVLKEVLFDASIYSTPTLANGTLFITDRSRLYAIATQ